MAEHGGHGHERHESAEHGGKHGEWMKHAVNGLAAAGITVGIAKYGTAILQAATCALAPYMGFIGLAFGALFLSNRYGKKEPARGHGGGHH